jgi:ribonuclease P protein component
LKNSDFLRVYRKGKRKADGYCTVYVLPNDNLDAAANRFGVSCSRKVGNSVTRHLVTRRYREIFRAWDKQNVLSKHCDVVISVNPDASKAEFNDLKSSLYGLLECILKIYV